MYKEIALSFASFFLSVPLLLFPLPFPFPALLLLLLPLLRAMRPSNAVVFHQTLLKNGLVKHDFSKRCKNNGLVKMRFTKPLFL